MSRMPPRTENSPGNSTADVLWKRFSASQRVKSASRTSSPTRSERVCRATVSRSGTGCNSPWIQATTTLGAAGPPNSFNTRTRSPNTSSRRMRSVASDSRAANRSGVSRLNRLKSSIRRSTSSA